MLIIPIYVISIVPTNVNAWALWIMYLGTCVLEWAKHTTRRPSSLGTLLKTKFLEPLVLQNPFHQTLLCAAFCWNWASGSGKNWQFRYYLFFHPMMHCVMFKKKRYSVFVFEKKDNFIAHIWAKRSSELFWSPVEVVRLSVCPSVCTHFTLSSPEPLGQFQPSLNQLILVWRGFKFVKKGIL